MFSCCDFTLLRQSRTASSLYSDSVWEILKVDLCSDESLSITVADWGSGGFQQVNVVVLGGVSSLQACSQHWNSCPTLFAFVYLWQVVFISPCQHSCFFIYAHNSGFIFSIFLCNEWVSRFSSTTMGMTVSLIGITELRVHSWRSACT